MGFSSPLQLVFRTHHSPDVSLHLYAESSLDHDLQVSGSHHRLSKGNLHLPPDHGQQLTSSSLTDDSEDFHCDHFAVQNHLVVHRLSHTPNFERQSRVSGIPSRTHMHGSHEVYGELFDRYETQRPYQASSPLRFHHFSFVCLSVAFSIDNVLLRTWLTFFFSFKPRTGFIVTPFSAIATQPILRDLPRFCSTPIRSTCDFEIRLEDKLEFFSFLRVSTIRSRSSHQSAIHFALSSFQVITRFTWKPQPKTREYFSPQFVMGRRLLLPRKDFTLLFIECHRVCLHFSCHSTEFQIRR